MGDIVSSGRTCSALPTVSMSLDGVEDRLLDVGEIEI